MNETFWTALSSSILLLFCMLMPAGVSAQSLWLTPMPSDNVTLEAHKPLYANLEGITFMTSAWHLSARYGLIERVQAVGELGLAHFGQDVVVDDDVVLQDFRETAVGNVFLGLTYFPRVSGLTVTLGGRLPVATDNTGTVTGIYTDPYRYEAFIIDYSSLLLELTYLLAITEEVSIRMVGKPAVHFDHFDAGEVDRGGTDLSVRYALQGWYETDELRGAVGVTGSASLITGLHMGLYDSNVVAVSTSIVGKLGGVEPGIIVQVPFTDAYSEVVDAVVGLTVSVPLR